MREGAPASPARSRAPRFRARRAMHEGALLASEPYVDGLGARRAMREGVPGWEREEARPNGFDSRLRARGA